jgi:hypothetical protein
MRHYHQLTSEKYLQHALEHDFRDVKRLRNIKAIQDFVTFLAGLGAMAIGVYLVQHQDRWVPFVTQWLEW